MCGVGSGRADNPGIGSPPGSGASQAGSKEDNPHSIAHAHHLTGGFAGQLAGETPPFRGKKKKKGKKAPWGSWSACSPVPTLPPWQPGTLGW